MSSSLSMPATGAVIQSVSQTKGAIGYVGLAYLSPRVKAIAVSYDDGKHYVLPSLENGKKKLYPVVRPLYYYYNVANKEKVTPFIDYILSPEGQNIIKTVDIFLLNKGYPKKNAYFCSKSVKLISQ